MLTCSLWDAMNTKQANLVELKVGHSNTLLFFFSYFYS